MRNFTCALFLWLTAFTHTEASDRWLDVWDNLISNSPVIIQATAEKEVKSFVRLLASDPLGVVCDFPARTYLAAQIEGFDFNALIAKCAELNEFIQKVPFEKLSLVFASEEISAPASIMGHAFLQVDGTDKSGAQKSYAISYLTFLDSFNVPYLTYSLLIGGANGFLTLGRSETEIAKYVNYAKRTVWSLPLDKTGRDLTFLQLYIWELRQNTPDYYFVTFNCATLLDHLLAITDDSRVVGRSTFLTPRVLFKRYSKGKEKLISVHPSVDWILRSMGAAISINKAAYIRENIISSDTSWLETETNPGRLLFASSYAEKLRRSQKISDESAIRQISAVGVRLNDLGINPDEFYVQNYKNPIHTSVPSSLYTGLVNRETNRIFLGYRPVAKDLMVSGGQYFSQQESILGLMEVSIAPDTNNFRLEKLVLASMKSLTPTTDYAPSSSFAFDLKAERDDNDKLTSRLHGLWGQSREISSDVMGYVLFGGGIGSKPGEDKHSYAASEIGLFLELIMKSRARLAHEVVAWGFNRNKVIEKQTIEFQKDFGLSSSISTSWTKSVRRYASEKDTEVFEVTISKYF